MKPVTKDQLVETFVQFYGPDVEAKIDDLSRAARDILLDNIQNPHPNQVLVARALRVMDDFLESVEKRGWIHFVFYANVVYMRVTAEDFGIE
jgi:hypothetical protein